MFLFNEARKPKVPQFQLLNMNIYIFFYFTKLNIFGLLTVQGI